MKANLALGSAPAVSSPSQACYLCTRLIPLESPMATYIGRRRYLDGRDAARLYELAADQGNALFQANGLAGLDNGGAINAVLISGTGTDGGMT
jgi:hypothetical protein